MNKIDLKGIGRAPTSFRGSLAQGLAPSSEVSLDGGKFGAGFIKNYAVITRGEALGHQFWVDRDFVAQVSESLGGQGVKSRFTHPDMSSDGLASRLGRTYRAPSDNPDVARGDLHFSKVSRKTSDGDLAAHVVTLAEEDPTSFGASISFKIDMEATRLFNEEHGASWVEDEDYFSGGYWDLENFQSPDPLNTKNYLHVRLAENFASDIVDDPAANPDGLFCKDPVFQDAEALASFALGQTTEAPELLSFDVDPNRLASFFNRFLTSRGLAIMPVDKRPKLGNKKESLNGEDSGPAPADPNETPDGAPAPVVEETVEEAPVDDVEETVDEAPADSPAEEAPGDQLSSGREEFNRYVEAFGSELGGEYFGQGLNFSDAQTAFNKALKAENESLKKKLKANAQSEPTPLSSEDPGAKSKSGFAAKIKIK